MSFGYGDDRDRYRPPPSNMQVAAVWMLFVGFFAVAILLSLFYSP